MTSLSSFLHPFVTFPFSVSSTIIILFLHFGDFLSIFTLNTVLNKHSYLRMCPMHLLFLLLISIISFGVLFTNFRTSTSSVCLSTLLSSSHSKPTFQMPPVSQYPLSFNSTFLNRTLSHSTPGTVPVVSSPPVSLHLSLFFGS